MTSQFSLSDQKEIQKFNFSYIYITNTTYPPTDLEIFEILGYLEGPDQAEIFFWRNSEDQKSPVRILKFFKNFSKKKFRVEMKFRAKNGVRMVGKSEDWQK